MALKKKMYYASVDWEIKIIFTLCLGYCLVLVKLCKPPPDLQLVRERVINEPHGSTGMKMFVTSQTASSFTYHWSGETRVPKSGLLGSRRATRQPMLRKKTNKKPSVCKLQVRKSRARSHPAEERMRELAQAPAFCADGPGNEWNFPLP